MSVSGYSDHLCSVACWSCGWDVGFWIQRPFVQNSILLTRVRYRLLDTATICEVLHAGHVGEMSVSGYSDHLCSVACWSRG